LDEPTTNLDKQGIALYHHLIKTLCNNRLVLICSNDAIEYESCSTIVSMSV
jgi:ABC-type multidrug transport system ATPase subunit